MYGEYPRDAKLHNGCPMASYMRLTPIERPITRMDKDL